MKSGVGLALFVVVTALMPADSAQTAGNSPRATPAAKMQFSFGRYWNGCGPVDQPTSGMTLTTVRSRCKKPDGLPDPPYINMQFVDSGSAPVVVVQGTSPQSASVSRCLKTGSACDNAIGGTIDFGASIGLRVTRPASYDLKFKDGSTEKGTFTTLPPCVRVVCW
jgi:hypothetical protein